MSSSDEPTSQPELPPAQPEGGTQELTVRVIKSGSSLVLWTLALLAAAWLSLAWTLKPADRTAADFFCIFYPSFTLVSQGKYSELYPPTTSTSPETPTFTAEVERLFPTLQNSRKPIFPYPPAFAGFLSPLALFSPWVAFNILSFVSISALAVSYSLLAEKKTLLEILRVTFLSIAFAPNWHCLSLGQMSIWMGIGILTLGYWACLRKRFVGAGLIWSLLILKPVYLVAPALIALSLALDKKCKLLISIAVGAAAIFAVSALWFSIGVLSQWLHLLRLFGEAILKNELEVSFVVGVVPAITVLLPTSVRLIGTNLLSGLMLIAAIAFVFYLSQLLKKETSWRNALPKAMVASISFTPLLAPYIRFYDLTIDWVAAIIILQTAFATADWLYMARLMSATFVVLEIYFWLITLAPHWQFNQPLLFLAVFLFLQFKLVKHFLRLEPMPRADA